MRAGRPVLEALRASIVEGGYPPGAPLDVDALAAEHDVSRIPVREALMTLVGEGLLEHRPRRGYTVTRLGDGELVELFGVRATLERSALAVAVRVRTPDDVAAARAAHEALLRAVATADDREYHRRSRQFHLALTRPSGMLRLLGVFERIWDVTEAYRPMEALDPREAEALRGEHEQMLQAFAEGDGERLLAVADQHSGHLSDRVRRLPPPSDLPPAPTRRARRRTVVPDVVQEEDR
ncbi:GntR family transcriptional regulator [Kineococcus gynurae]|uniref:GntR family transcriptional regulator n=1 Tax=Kineococcus gynurae TaxID=452979 RepID=A0ABV5LS19_9ACTN